MNCYTDQAGSYVCESKDPSVAVAHDWMSWIASPVNLTLWIGACLLVALYVQHRRQVRAEQERAWDGGPVKGAASRLMDHVEKPAPRTKGPYR